jgi:hypothetical protein
MDSKALKVNKIKNYDTMITVKLKKLKRIDYKSIL